VKGKVFPVQAQKAYNEEELWTLTSTLDGNEWSKYPGCFTCGERTPLGC
jgi:hypothetical protein